MRRKMNEISIEEAKTLLKECRIAVVAVNGDDGYPYAIPINFLYVEGANRIYFHGARVGHKFDALQASDKVCLTVMGAETIKKEAWAPYVKSAVVFGRCHTMETGEQSMAVLRAFAGKYYPSVELVEETIARSGKATQMFEIEVEHISGKEIQEK